VNSCDQTDTTESLKEIFLKFASTLSTVFVPILLIRTSYRRRSLKKFKPIVFHKPLILGIYAAADLENDPTD